MGSFLGNHDFSAFLTVIGRYPVSPPQLSGDTPVADTFQPVEICLSEALRNKGKAAVLKGLNGRLSHLLHLYKPLLLHHGLYRGLAAVMGSYVMGVGNHLDQQALGLQISHNGLPGLVAVHTKIWSRNIYRGIVV